MKNEKKISVIIPVFNVEQYLGKCIESILTQTFKEFELILINDGSTDQSKLICELYQEKDKRVRVINKNNTGTSDTRNIGLDIAVGKYISFIDSDDWIDKNMFLDMYELAEKHNSNITISGIKFDKIDVFGEIKNTQINNYKLSIWDSKEKLRHNIINLFPNALINSSCNKLYSRELLIKNYIRFRETNIGEDTTFNLDAIKYAESMVVTNESYYHYMKYEATETLTDRLDENAFNRYLEVHAQMKNLFNEWGLLDEKIIKEINKTMFSQYWTTILKILNADRDIYSYRKKKKLLDNGLKRLEIIETFNSVLCFSNKEKILRFIVKKRFYCLAYLMLSNKIRG